LPLTGGPSDFDFEREPALAAAGGGAGAGGVASTFAGVRTLPCFALVQLASDGLAGAAPAQRGTSATARADEAEMTSSSDGRSKILMINHLASGTME
jgi:hypothetical protein